PPLLTRNAGRPDIRESISSAIRRSESEPILSDAFVEVTCVRRKIEVIVDPSVNPHSVANLTKQVDEDPNDPNQLRGTELIMKELGAQVIAESDK
ncbi:MAG: hypothetical protein ACOVQZ_01635, partial [Candidatus Nanopelagicaceae bacterium]